MSQPNGLDTAWKIHNTLIDWTGKADAKASFTLTIESAVIGGVIALSNKDRALGQLGEGFPLLLYRFGMVTLSAGVLFAAAAVIPQIRGRLALRNWQDNFIYFGHLRYWKPADLEKALIKDELLPVLSRQLIGMSKIAWSKYRLVQVSLGSAVFGAFMIALAGILA